MNITEKENKWPIIFHFGTIAYRKFPIIYFKEKNILINF